MEPFSPSYSIPYIYYMCISIRAVCCMLFLPMRHTRHLIRDSKELSRAHINISTFWESKNINCEIHILVSYSDIQTSNQPVCLSLLRNIFLGQNCLKAIRMDYQSIHSNALLKLYVSKNWWKTLAFCAIAEIKLRKKKTFNLSCSLYVRLSKIKSHFNI